MAPPSPNTAFRQSFEAWRWVRYPTSVQAPKTTCETSSGIWGNVVLCLHEFKSSIDYYNWYPKHTIKTTRNWGLLWFGGLVDCTWKRTRCSYIQRIHEGLSWGSPFATEEDLRRILVQPEIRCGFEAPIQESWWCGWVLTHGFRCFLLPVFLFLFYTPDLSVGLELDELNWPSTAVPRSMLLTSFYTLSLLASQDRFALQYALMQCIVNGRPWDCKVRHAPSSFDL